MRAFLQAWGGWILAVVFLALAGWLAGDWSASRYALVVEDDQILVERGSRFPLLWSAYEDSNPRLREIYAPVPRREGLEGTGGVFADRDQVDRALFTHLARWIRALTEKDDEKSHALAVEYLGRAEQLPTLSPAEEAELEKLRGLVGHAQARKEISRAIAALRTAKRGLISSIGAGGKLAADSAALADRIEEPLSALARLTTRRAAPDAQSEASSDPR